MEISSNEEIWKILNLLFVQKKVTLSNKYGKTYPAEVEIWQNFLKTKSSGNFQNSSERTLIAKANNKIFLCETKVKGITGDGALILEPFKIQVRQETNEDTKEYIPPTFYVSNVISISEVTVFLGDDEVKDIVKRHSLRLKHLFDIYNVFLSDKPDERTRLMRTYDLPIIILNRDDPQSVPNNSISYEDYLKSIRNEKAPLEFKAEICAPIKYRGHVIIGYVQVLHRKRLDINSFNLVSLVASSIRKDLSDYKNHEESREICKVINFTHTEITFLHSMNIHFSRIFYIGNLVILNLVANKEIKMTLKALIRNITPLDKFFSVTAQFQNLSLDQLEKIEELVELAGFTQED